MSSLYAKITNLFDQDFYNFEEGKPILDFLMKHKEDIERFEAEYNAQIQIALEDFDEMQKENDKLGQQLLQKDKEIEFLTKQNKALVEEEDLLGKKLKELGVDCIEDLYKVRHQICEEIRSCYRNTSYFGEDKYAMGFIEAIIDEVEQGEIV